ncbi:hypothetical protein [uncultured Bacteroides sp.]|uniref:hypothetical protein n=1 Tax=uncultured Bacteroides sp. TaxID=162156 RepID=UPI002AAB05AC|nr:hypothetical protein [uncultured Bacteroides sp.]
MKILSQTYRTSLRKGIALLFFLILPVAFANAEVKLPRLIADGMVLQRNTELKLPNLPFICMQLPNFMEAKAWADNPQGANLRNREGLPASPLRTNK